jgi:pimeloyl-ACP methyl ester carboxylesterase
MIFNDYVVFWPDYIGYGSSSNILHPYYIYEPTVIPVIDMIKAGENYLNVNNVKYNSQKLFLTGHSEGGYVTLAVQKELETHPVNGIHVIASAPSAGPYDLIATGNILFNAVSYPSPDYILLILTAYNNYYWQLPLTDFFQPLYASNAMKLLNGNYNDYEINETLTTNLASLLSTTFLSNYRANGDSAIKATFKINSVNNWTPKTPTRLYQGTIDSIVPLQIAQETYQTFISNGSDTSIVKLVLDQGVGHDYIPAYLKILPWFKSFK